ncbi:hypothetical protein [Lichenicoccus sp.]|uniref:hypothetical protein n=1 Tax=Lichenicoccus sp. TaxID=2781899 RepID=UPI003D0AF1DC
MPRHLILTAGLLAGLTCRAAYAVPLVPGQDFQREQGEYKSAIDGQVGGWTAGRLLDDQGRTMLCVATDDRQRLTLTANRSALQLRIDDPSWSLAPGVIYPMTLKVGPLAQSFEMETDGATTLRADQIEPTDLIALLDAMGKASRVNLDQSGASERMIALAGSTKVLSLFRACATRAGFANLAE